MKDFDAQEGDRRLSNVIEMGVVEQVDYSNPPRARVRIGDALTGWLRMGTPRAGGNTDWSVYEPGEEVLIAASSGELRNGVIVCAINNGTNTAKASSADIRRIDLGDGSYVIHDRGSGNLTLNATGDISIVSGGSVTITAPENVTVNGDVIADGISLKTHVHGGISPGPADTGQPK